MSKYKWVEPQCDENAAHKLAQDIGASPVVARLLMGRGVETPEEAREFLSPSLDHLHDPMLLPDMSAGVERMARAIETGEKILVHGDYDVDGVSSAALLVRTLKRLGANVAYRVPHRKRDGYDIKPVTADDAKKMGVGLIITADCGVTACETINRAASHGIDIIVTDHHEQGAALPDAVAVINPMRHDSKYPFKRLAGVGVALKFCQALVRHLGYNERNYLNRFLDLAALGTIADVMPLTGENRAIVKFGLETLMNTKKTGLKALIARAGLGDKPISGRSVGFGIAPRINAVGRLDDAAKALELLLTSDKVKADKLADRLEKLNQERQSIQARILDEARELLNGKDIDALRAIVLCSPGWNSGVVGIVASKIVEEYCRPTALLTLAEGGEAAHGSARSIEAFNMISALNQCRDILRTAGGHALAAGLTLSADKVIEFESRMNRIAGETITEEDMIPKLETEGEISLQDVSLELHEEIERLEPYGHGNPEPLFITTDVQALDFRRVGTDGAHLKLQVSDKSGVQLGCIGFGLGELESDIGASEKLDICYNISANTFNGYTSVQLRLKDIRAR